MIVDSHQHFWDLEAVEYGWIVPEYGPIYRNFSPEDLLPHLKSTGVERTVVVQAANSLADTDSMLALAAAHDFIGAVVGWLPLADAAALEETLENGYGANPYLKGARHLNHDEPDPDWLISPEVLAGLHVLENNGLVFDIVAVHPLHLPHVPTIVAACPHLTIVVDHLGKPPIVTGDLTEWKANLAAVASTANVYGKVSGLNTAADWETWDANDLVEPIGFALETLGPDRVMFGSDWPVAVLAGTYDKVWTETRRALDLVGAGPREKEAVLGGTAARVYQIG